jgi:hypothetical protein
MNADPTTEHRTLDELVTSYAAMTPSPSDGGAVEMFVRRPGDNLREVIESGELDPEHGLVGDKWREESLRHGNGNDLERDVQLTLMNARVIDMIAGERERWPLAGDQLYVDLDLGAENLPPGTRLSIGTATVEVSAEPHTGCGAFAERFGSDAMRFINASERRHLRLRGINARVVAAGVVSTGDRVRKIGDIG